MPFTTVGLDKLVSHNISKLTHCNISDISIKFPERVYWIANSALNSFFGGELSQEEKVFIFFFVRRAESAFNEYKYALETLKQYFSTKDKQISLYFNTLHHLEMTITMMWQAYMMYIQVAKKQLFTKGDGSVYCRLNGIYNFSRHFDPSLLLTDHLHAIWITNDGIETDNDRLTFTEIEACLTEIGDAANEYCKAGK